MWFIRGLLSFCTALMLGGFGWGGLRRIDYFRLTIEKTGNRKEETEDRGQKKAFLPDGRKASHGAYGFQTRIGSQENPGFQLSSGSQYAVGFHMVSELAAGLWVSVRLWLATS